MERGSTKGEELGCAVRCRYETKKRKSEENFFRLEAKQVDFTCVPKNIKLKHRVKAKRNKNEHKGFKTKKEKTIIRV